MNIVDLHNIGSDENALVYNHDGHRSHFGSLRPNCFGQVSDQLL